MAKAKTLAVIDAETDPFLFGRVPEAFIWDIYDGEKHYTFEHVSDAIHFLHDKKWVVYAHNGGKFDYLLKGFLDEVDQFSKIMDINGRLAKFKIGDCEFRDSYNILPIPLADFEKLEIDYAKMERKVRHLHMEEITRYLHGDTESLHKLVKAFRDEYGDGITLAGSAMKFWQRFTKKKAPKSTKAFYNALSPFYHGGRVEAFHLGIVEEDCTMVDINSAYPFAMLSEHPIDTHYTKREHHKDEKIHGHYLYSVRCRSFGAFGHYVRGEGLRFPVDQERRLYHTTGWELSCAIEQNLILDWEIEEVYEFTNTINFSPYILYHYEQRKKVGKKTPHGIFHKLMMNSLYGKFGANPQNYRDYTLAEPKFQNAMEQEGYEFAGELGPWIMMALPLSPEQERYYNVATAASITGYVRAMLLTEMCRIRKTGGKVLYCDTDSIVFSGGKAPDFGTDLGGWSCDGQFKRGGIAGKKLYAFETTDEWAREKGLTGDDRWKTACKGVRISPQEIMRVAHGEEVKYQRDAPSFKLDGSCSFITRRVNRKDRVKRRGR